jgi:Putative restriction endonuclease
MPDRMTKIAVPDTLVDGQRLDQPTFHTIYQAMPAGTRAELIDGVVHMPSPMGRAHGRAQLPVNMWLGQYAENTPGVEVLVGATTILGWRSEPQPDALLRILTEHGGRSHEEQGLHQRSSGARRRGFQVDPDHRPRGKAGRLRAGGCP